MRAGFTSSLTGALNVCVHVCLQTCTRVSTDVHTCAAIAHADAQTCVHTYHTRQYRPPASKGVSGDLDVWKA